MVLLPLVALAALFLSGITLAQSDGGYDLSWSTVDGGGYTFSIGGGYELGGTIGQPDAGEMSGGGYTSVVASGVALSSISTAFSSP